MPASPPSLSLKSKNKNMPAIKTRPETSNKYTLYFEFSIKNISSLSFFLAFNQTAHQGEPILYTFFKYSHLLDRATAWI